MIYKNSLNFFVIFFIICILVLYGCNKDENPVKPQSPSGYSFDSTSYDWRCDTIIADAFYPPFIADTTNIFFREMYGSFIYYNGKNYHYFYPSNIFPLALGGYDINNIYIGGNLQIGNTNNYIMKIQKWTGSGFNEMPTVDTSFNTFNSIGNIYCRALNEIWLGTVKGSLYKFDGHASYQRYLIDTNYKFDFLTTFYETNNSFYVFGYRFKDVYTIDTLKIFQYENDNWNVVYQKKIFNQTEEIFNYQVISGQLYALHRDGLYEFEGNDFIKVFNIDEFSCDFGLQGSSLDEFGVEGYNRPNDPQYTNFYHWNGTKWSFEFKNVYGELYVSKVADRYIILCNNNSLSTFIYYGNPKKSFKK